MNNSPHHCVVCGQDVEKFIPYRGGWTHLPQLMQLLDWVGSDVDNFMCPNCGAHDRERHLILYLVKLELLWKFKNSRVLHFAPEQWFSKVIELQQPETYIKADLFPASAEIQKVDLLNTDFKDGFFDVVVANHVLEHVESDEKALIEVRRILKPSGLAILQTPYTPRLETTISDPGIDDDKTRLELFGQEDHVRLYGRDIFTRIERAGFESLATNHETTLPEFDPNFYGVNYKEPLFLFQRSGD